MKQRLISAIVVLIITIPTIIIGGYLFKIISCLLGILCLREIFLLQNQQLHPLIKYLSYVLIGLLIFFDIDIIIKILICILFFNLLMIFIKKDYNIVDSSLLINMSIIIIFFFSYMNIYLNEDINIILYLLLITILTDTFAYIGGKLFGKHKLIERISPNKTIEGSIIGSIFGIVFPSIFYLYMVNPGELFIKVIALTLILSLIGQLGDLVFSSIKRHYNIKDFSNIMPGHGGILDRLDSIIFVLIAFAILINIM